MAKKSTAVARTISLFTGKTDEESSLARDGSLPEELSRRPRGREYRWHVNGAGFSWSYGYRASGGWVDRGFVNNQDDDYHAWCHVGSGPARVFPTLTKAAEWVEDMVHRS